MCYEELNDEEEEELINLKIEEEIIKLKISQFDPSLVKDDFRRIEFVDWEEEFYIVKKGFLSTRRWHMLSKKIKMNEIKFITAKELFDHDFELLEILFPERFSSTSLMSKIRNIDIFPDDPLILFLLTYDAIPQRFPLDYPGREIRIRLNNPEKIKSLLQDKARSFNSETIYIFYPFEKIKSKYISIDWVSQFDLVLRFSQWDEENYEETFEIYTFLSFLRRYLKSTCDADFLQMEFYEN